MLALGFLLACIGIVLFVLSQHQRAQLRQLRAAQRSTTKELTAFAESVSQALVEAGNYRQTAEVTGIIRCNSPLTSEIAKQPCVYYDAEVRREYEETRYRSRRHGRRVSSRTMRGSETVSHNSQRVHFWVEDATGRVLVDPTGAEIEPVQIADRFEPAETAGSSRSLTIGKLSITLGGLPTTMDAGRRTIGYRCRERALPVDRRVYVLGEVTDASGELTIQKPRQKGKFVISLRSKDEIVRSVVIRTQVMAATSAGSGVAGVALIGLSLLHII